MPPVPTAFRAGRRSRPGAYLQSRRGKSISEVAHFLWTRGLWLVVLELTWVRWVGWQMNFGNEQIFLVLHNALDGIAPAQFGALGWLRKILHVPASITVSAHTDVLANYSLIPWIFVMAAGYCFGRVSS